MAPGQVLGIFHPHWRHRKNSWLMALTWLWPGHWSHLGSEFVDGKFLYLPSSFWSSSFKHIHKSLLNNLNSKHVYKSTSIPNHASNLSVTMLATTCKSVVANCVSPYFFKVPWPDAILRRLRKDALNLTGPTSGHISNMLTAVKGSFQAKCLRWIELLLPYVLCTLWSEFLWPLPS